MLGLTGLRLYAAIAGAVAVALLLAWVWRIDTLRARHLREAQAAELRHAVTTASLKECNGHIADNNARIEAANKRLQSDREKAAADIARADARWKATDARRSALEASARRTDLPACRVSPEALRALEGL